MQFKQVGRRIQVLAYRGYDREKKRAVVKLLGSFSRYLPEIDSDLDAALDDAERAEVQSYIEKIRQSSDLNERQYQVKYAASGIARAADSLKLDEIQCTEEQAAAMFEAMATLSRALKKRGFKRPRPAPVTSHQAAPGQLPLEPQ